MTALARLRDRFVGLVLGDAGGGIVLLLAAIGAILMANSPFSFVHWRIWHHVIAIDLGFVSVSHDLQHWVNDGLMTIFFFLVGLEIKREMVDGSLSNLRAASLPLIAALGGMIVPAGIYAVLNWGGPGSSGWGIPMATDIAFALGVLALLGRSMPSTLRLFLLALATVDDIGAILVIAVFYTEKLSFSALAFAAVLLTAMIVMRRTRVRSDFLLLFTGVLFWFAVLMSGIHATIAGVILGLVTPTTAPLDYHSTAEFSDMLVRRLRSALHRADYDTAKHMIEELGELVEDTQSPVERLEHAIRPWVTYAVLPLFALANSGIVLSWSELRGAVTHPVTLGVAFGLVLGKVVGVLGFSWIAVRLRIAELPGGATWAHMAGIGLLAGIGFTVSLFITGLAFTDERLVTNAKLAILVASAVAGTAGFFVLRLLAARRRVKQEQPVAA